MAQIKTTTCPTCRKRGDWLAGAWVPFCSQRCKLVDLGRWLGEDHAISEPLRPAHFQEDADVPPGRQRDRPETGDRE